ncbi:hypothetical protein Q5P01_024971 [Channa striata]|uniref:Uncharacterized protein n=1 Tax=Channa striata TaxID=64152 RepID=A0AA88J508_CHASR|nr:hypothetical protein Q5P01_024971 [Channa striata]
MRMDSMKLHKRTKDITHAHTSLQEDVETYFCNSAVHGDFRQWLVDRSDLQDKPFYPRHAAVFVTEGRYDRLHWIEAAQLLNTAALVSLPNPALPSSGSDHLILEKTLDFSAAPVQPLRRLHADATAATPHGTTRRYKMASEVPADSLLMARLTRFTSARLSRCAALMNGSRSLRCAQETVFSLHVMYEIN